VTDPTSKIGKVVWTDLTVPDAAALAEFYHAVAGWEPRAEAKECGDFNMLLPGTQTPAAGVCYARGANANIPPQWMIYVPVKDLTASIRACEQRGGQVVCRLSFNGVVIRDPAGAVMAIMQA
jgi:predicted enzyme related to lactoylglutathione lyase